MRARECSEIRVWFQGVERRLGVLEAELRTNNSQTALTKLAADQQASSSFFSLHGDGSLLVDQRPGTILILDRDAGHKRIV